MNEWKICTKANIKFVIKSKFIWSSILVTNILIYMLYQFLAYSFERNFWWFAHAIFLFVSTFSVPIVLYPVFNDKNREMIKNIVYVKMKNRNIYELSVLLSYFIVLFIPFLFSSLFMTLLNRILGRGVNAMAQALFIPVAVMFIFIYLICMFALIVKITDKYLIGVLIFMILNLYFLASTNIFWGLFIPLDISNTSWVVEYLAGKAFLAAVAFSAIYLYLYLKNNN